MDSVTLLSVVGGVISVLSIVILTGLCVNCRGTSQQKVISQHYTSGTMNSGFTVVRPFAEHATLPTQTLPHHLSSPLIPAIRQPSPCPSTNSESQSDYVNDETGNITNSYEEPAKECPDYIIVLADDHSPPSHHSNLSLASSAQSVEKYINVTDLQNNCNTLPAPPISAVASFIEDEDEEDNDDDDDDDNDCPAYINISDSEKHTAYPDAESLDSCNEDPDCDYVNAPNQVNTYLG